MSPQPKTEAILVRMGGDEEMMLTDLSNHTGLTRADVIRQLIRREFKSIFPDVHYVQAVSKEAAVADFEKQQAKGKAAKKAKTKAKR